MNPKIHKIVEHINSNLHGELTIGDLAGLAKLSRSRMCWLFRAEAGMSPGQFVKTARMKRAAELLQSTSLSVRQIRAMIGMQDESHFVRAFKKTYGLAPSDYRVKKKGSPHP